MHNYIIKYLNYLTNANIMKKSIAKKSLELGIGCCKIAYPNVSKTIEDNFTLIETLENHSSILRFFLKTFVIIYKAAKVLMLLGLIFLVSFAFLEYCRFYIMYQGRVDMRS